MPAVAIALLSPVVVSCSVEKPKVETQEEKEKRLEHQRSMELAPNLTKFLDDYYDEEKYYREGRDTSEMKVIESIKQFKELTSNINHLNDFEKSYLGLYEDIQNFFDNSMHKYTKDNISFDYLHNKSEKIFIDKRTFIKERDVIYGINIKLEENTITQEQMFYHQIYQIINKYGSYGLEGTTSKYIENKEVLITEVLEKEISPIINEKIIEFSKKHKDFQFKNPKLTFKETKTGIVIDVSLEVEYQNQKLPEQIVFPLTFNLKPVNIFYYLKTEKELNDEFLKEKNKERNNVKINNNLERKNVKTFAEMENVLNSKDDEYYKEKLKNLKENYQQFLDDNDKEVEM